MQDFRYAGLDIFNANSEHSVFSIVFSVCVFPFPFLVFYLEIQKNIINFVNQKTYIVWESLSIHFRIGDSS